MTYCAWISALSEVLLLLILQVVMFRVLVWVLGSAMDLPLLTVVATTLITRVLKIVGRDGTSMLTGSVFVPEAGESRTAQVGSRRGRELGYVYLKLMSL